MGVGARAALGAVIHFVPLVVAAGIPLIVHQIDRNPRAQEVPQEFMRVTDLWLEFATILSPYARTAGAAGVLIGLALFVAAGFLVRGSDAGRRVTRGLLVLQAVQTIAAAAWAASVVLGPMADWARRYATAISELQEAWPGIEERFPSAFDGSGWPSIAGCAVVCVVSLALDGALIWLTGGTNARAWCAARAKGRAVATPPAPR